MTISKRQRRSAKSATANYPGLSGAVIPKRRVSKAASVASTPTPTEANVGVGAVDSGSLRPAQDDIEPPKPVGVDGVKEEEIKTESVGVDGAEKAKEIVENVVEDVGVGRVNIDDMQLPSPPAYAAPSEDMGVGDTFSDIAQTHRLMIKRFDAPRRVYHTPTWNSMVAFVTHKQPGAGTFYNSHTTYAEWYTGFSIAAMYDDLVLYWGLIVRGALPSIWPQGPLQAINEAKAAGVHISNNGVLNPGKDFYQWMINGKVRTWIDGYLKSTYPGGIDID